MHALADLALRSLTRGAAGEKHTLDAAAAARVSRALSDYFGRAELAAAVKALVELAFLLETRESSPRAAAALLEVAATAARPLRAAREAVTARARTFTRFEGTRAAAPAAAVPAPSAEMVRLLEAAKHAYRIELRRPAIRRAPE